MQKLHHAQPATNYDPAMDRTIGKHTPIGGDNNSATSSHCPVVPQPGLNSIAVPRKRLGKLSNAPAHTDLLALHGLHDKLGQVEGLGGSAKQCRLHHVEAPQRQRKLAS
jgi:hypothetical protein